MIHVDARMPDQFYDERYDLYICFLMRGSGRSKTMQSAVLRPRFGGEGSPMGEEGARSFQNRHGNETVPSWEKQTVLNTPIKCEKYIFSEKSCCTC